MGLKWLLHMHIRPSSRIGRVDHGVVNQYGERTRANMWNRFRQLEEVNRKIGIHRSRRMDPTDLHYTTPARVRNMSFQGRPSFSMPIMDGRMMQVRMAPGVCAVMKARTLGELMEIEEDSNRLR